MQTRVLLFASLREAAAASEVSLELVEGCAASAVISELECLLPKKSGLLKRCVLAINAEYAAPEQALRQGDIVAVIPPVSGGSLDI